MGLAHEAVPAGLLDSSCTRFAEALLKGGPGAQAEAKILIREVAHGRPPDRPVAAGEAAARLARLRTQAEAQEGFAAFFAKRRPTWRGD
jgi:methylglutaconyl-CoA hydratase